MADMATQFSEKLLADIEAYLSQTGMSISYFGKRSAKNSELVKRLREGRPIQSDTEQRVRDFMRHHKPRVSKAKQSEAAV